MRECFRDEVTAKRRRFLVRLLRRLVSVPRFFMEIRND